ncbi:MAG TPA: hypothetical protein VJV79_05585, partial [Polyangiaceae bacterium]|nr:hypothetical protein [Polyangiaceae bacterium]
PAAAAAAWSAAPAEAPVSPPPARAAGASHDKTGHFMIGAAWNVAFPVGSVHQFTNAVSGLGFEFLARYLVLPQLSIGGSTDFQTFVASQPRTTYQLNNGALTATAYNSVRVAVVRATAHYYFLKDGPVLPYAGANIGIGWSTFQSSAADLVIYDNQASVVFGADVGTLFPLNDSKLALLTAVRYSAMPAVDFLAVSNVQTLSLQFGVLAL